MASSPLPIFKTLAESAFFDDQATGWPNQVLPSGFLENLDNDDEDFEVSRTALNRNGKFDPVVGSARSGSTGFFDALESSPTPEPVAEPSAGGEKLKQALNFDEPSLNVFGQMNINMMNNLASLLELQQQDQQQPPQQLQQLQQHMLPSPQQQLVMASSPFDSLPTWGQAGMKPEHSTMQIRCKFGVNGSDQGQFSLPHGFCLGNNEEIIVADTLNHRIQIFSKEGYFQRSFGEAGKDEGHLWYPRKIAFSRMSRHFIICDRGNERSRMQIFSEDGYFIRRINIRFIDIVAGLAINRFGNIVAVDSVTPTVFVLSECGRVIHYLECSDFMSEPSDIAIYNDEYFICDFKGHRVVVLNENGKLIRSIGSQSVTLYPNGIDISDAGDVLIGDSHGNQFHVAVYDRLGGLISQFQCPQVKVSRCCGLKITSEGFVVTLAKNNHHVLVLNTLFVP